MFNKSNATLDLCTLRVLWKTVSGIKEFNAQQYIKRHQLRFYQGSVCQRVRIVTEQIVLHWSGIEQSKDKFTKRHQLHFLSRFHVKVSCQGFVSRFRVKVSCVKECEGVAQLVQRRTRDQRPKVRTPSESGAQEQFVTVFLSQKCCAGLVVGVPNPRVYTHA